MTKATPETDRIAEMEARLDEQSGAIGALATAVMVLQLAMRVEDVGKRIGFAEYKQTIEAALLMQQWPSDGERASKMLAAAQQTSGAAFHWVETMMEPLLDAWNVEMAARRMREESDRRLEEDLEHGSMPVGFFEKLKAADRTHRARVGNLEAMRFPRRA